MILIESLKTYQHKQKASFKKLAFCSVRKTITELGRSQEECQVERDKMFVVTCVRIACFLSRGTCM